MEKKDMINQLELMIDNLEKELDYRNKLEIEIKELQTIEKIIHIRLTLIKIIILINEFNNKKEFYEKYKKELLRLKRECEESIIDKETKYSDSFLKSFVGLTDSVEKLEEINKDRKK